MRRHFLSLAAGFLPGCNALTGGSNPQMSATQCFRMLIEPDLDAVIWVLHPFAIRSLRPQSITVRQVMDSGLSITACFPSLDEAEARDLVALLLKTPKVRAASVETIVASKRF